MRARNKFLLAVAVLWVAKVALTFALGRSILFPLVRGMIAFQHPGVEWVTPEELAAWQADATKQPPQLVDARTEPEYAVSHLPGARRVDPTGPLPAELLALPRSTPIVTYCAVGYRSAGAADRLRRAGFSHVWNLSGSIFRWANEGRPLEAAAGQVQRVHPVNWWWGYLLRRDRRAGLSSSPT